MPEEIFTTTELADRLKVPLPTIYTWRAVGRGPRAIRVGKHLRWRKCDVEAWLEENADPTKA